MNRNKLYSTLIQKLLCDSECNSCSVVLESGYSSYDVQENK